MNIQRFLQHHGLEENPFNAEEARLDPVLERLEAGGHGLEHPEFSKILGRLDQPATAVVFGEKGSGKTAIRLDIEKRIAEHNQKSPDKKVLVVAYDDLNPVLDRLQRAKKLDGPKVLDAIRLEDHQDAILALATTKLLNALSGGSGPDAGDPAVPLPPETLKSLKKLPVEQRRDLATLATLYDQPASADPVTRLARLRKKLRLGVNLHPNFWLWVGVVGLIAALVLGAWWWLDSADPPVWLLPAGVLAVAAALLGLGVWTYQRVRIWSLSRSILKEMPATQRSHEQLKTMLADTPSRTFADQPLPRTAGPDAGPRDDRYQLTRRLVALLRGFGYAGILVLVDRIDEPTLVSGDEERMKKIVWPMFDNKFLKQDHVGLKLLLPVELSYLLKRESSQFFQEARLDKQNMVERLSWSGATLYDLCSARLRAVRKPGIGPDRPGAESDQPRSAEPGATGGEGEASGMQSHEEGAPAAGAAAYAAPERGDTSGETSGGGTSGGKISLTDLFTEDVDRVQLIDALDQMQQPRDAFKFLYQVVQEHCRLMPDESAEFRIARLTLDSVRRDQSQRVQELHRGRQPA